MNTRFVCALLAGTSSLLMAMPASAQDNAPAGTTPSGTVDAAPADAPAPAVAAGQAAGASEDIIVTGTRIVRDGYTAPTPVTVATTDDLLRSTPSSIPDALNKLPQFGNSLSPGKSANNFSNFPIHGNVLNLRALGVPNNNPKGPLRTLVLFDGIRVPPTSYIGTIDTNVLPQMLMQRVDVVTGGASAGYGSDAVAGVVNFVLDKKFTGIKGVAQAGVSQRGDAQNQRLGLAGGWDFAGGAGHILLSGEYANNDGLLRSDRAIGRQSLVFVGSNPASCVLNATGQGRTCAAPGTATNPYTIASNVLISALAPNGRITASSVAGNPFVGHVINNDGTTRPFDLGTAVGTSGFQQGGDGYGIPADNAAIAPYKTYQTFGRVAYDVAPDITAYVQGGWSRSDLSYTTQQNALVPPSQAVTIFKGNPYLSSALDAALTSPTGTYTIGQTSAGQPKPLAKERTDFWMATAGLDGSFSSLKWSVNYTHGQSTHKMANSGLYDNQKLFAAVDAVRDTAGNITCRVLLDPDPAIRAKYAGCQPMDVLHGNPAASTPAGYAYATGTSRYRARIKQDSVQANLSGSLFDLPAGPVDFAVGAEYRHQSLDLVSNADPALLSSGNNATPDRVAYFSGLRGVPAGALYYWLTNVGGAQGSLNVKEAYAELAIPILKDTPFFQELSINGAGRITDYSTSGTVKTWKVGATWRPISDILFRGTVSRDIRAPNLYELFSGPASGIGIINDPRTADGSYGSGANVNVNNITIGNPTLKPEIAKTYTFGAVITPEFLRGFSLSVDYYSIRVDDLIETLTGQQIATNCFNANGVGAEECALITRATPTSGISLITITPKNIAFLKTVGFDFDASYRTELGNGALGVRLYANYIDKFDAQQYPGAPISHYAGTSVVITNPAGFPKIRGNFTLDYSNGPFGVTLTEQYIGKMRLDIPGGATRIRFVDDHVSPVWYTDLAVRFTVPQWDGNFELFGNINNLFDKKPPLIPGTVSGVNLPTNIAVYDFVGRAFTAGVRFKF